MKNKDDIVILIINVFVAFIINYIFMNVDFRYELAYKNIDYITLLVVLIFGPYIVATLFNLLKSIDRKRKNYEQIKKYYKYTKYYIAFILDIFIIIAIFSIRVDFNPSAFVLLTVSFILITSGIILPRLEQNSLIGIRTYWTLKDERVWKKTHKLGRYIFIFIGFFVFVAVFIDSVALYNTLIITSIVAILSLICYSYLQYRKLKNNI